MTARKRSGFALIAVLWVVVVIGVLFVELQLAARFTRTAAANERSAVRMRWAARAGLARELEVIDRRIGRNLAGTSLTVGGDSVLAPIEFEIDGTSVRVLAQDSRARVNLNRAGHLELRRLFDGVGLTTAAADSLADAILDWRDGDDLRRPRGAETAEYQSLRPPSRPRNGPFDAVEEVAGVWGMTAERFRRIAPYLTVSGDGRVNVNTAPAPVLLTIPTIDAGAAQALVRRRARAPFGNIYELLGALPLSARSEARARLGEITDRVAFTPRELEITSEASSPGTPARAALHANVLFSGSSAVSLLRVVER